MTAALLAVCIEIYGLQVCELRNLGGPVRPTAYHLVQESVLTCPAEVSRGCLRDHGKVSDLEEALLSRRRCPHRRAVDDVSTWVHVEGARGRVVLDDGAAALERHDLLLLGSGATCCHLCTTSAKEGD